MAEPTQPAEQGGSAARAALTLGAVGVVFGDIGTSPLYALQTVFSIDHGAVHPTEGDVDGVVSLVFWAITLIVSVKYVTFIMRASNEGEGGIMALTALVQRATAPQLERALREPALQTHLVVLDLHDLASMDRSGVHTVLDASCRARKAGTGWFSCRAP